jgi:hypothetical protein
MALFDVPRHSGERTSPRQIVSRGRNPAPGVDKLDSDFPRSDPNPIGLDL